MIRFKGKITIPFLLFFLLFAQTSYSQDQDVLEILEIIQKDLKTLEKAVYSDAGSEDLSIKTEFNQNDEDVLTRHLLKLSEIEDQFKNLTNKFEEINFKLDKLSNRISKTQADNQLRFQQLEEGGVIKIEDTQELSSLPKQSEEKILPGSSEPQDLGSISYKDTATNETTQQTQSVDTTSAVVTEVVQSEEKILPDETPEKQYE